MSEYVTVKIHAEDFVDMLMKRLREQWCSDEDTIALFRKMYEDYAYSGGFDGVELNVMRIVDNDYVNYLRVIDEDDYEYEEVKRAHDEGEYEATITVSSTHSFTVEIRAVSDDGRKFLITK